MKSTLLVLLAASLLIVSGCAGLTPASFAKGAAVHRNFPTLADAVTDCVAGNPEAYDALKPHFNALVDKWALANGKTMSDIALEAAAALDHMADIGREWEAAKLVLSSRGIDCGPAVASMARMAESSYDELNTGIRNSETLTTWLEIGSMVSGFVVQRTGSVVKM